MKDEESGKGRIGNFARGEKRRAALTPLPLLAATTTLGNPALADRGALSESFAEVADDRNSVGGRHF
jgi:hypothetical protein